MKRTTILLGVALVGLVAVSGLAAATGTFPGDVQATDATNGYGPGNGARENTTDAARPFDGSNSPWVTGDDRLERFQDRFNLTDQQVSAIQHEVQSLSDGNATRTDIRATVAEMLASYGVEDPELGPDGDRHAGSFGQQIADMARNNGFGHGGGPHGPADGDGTGYGPHGHGDGTCQG